MNEKPMEKKAELEIDLARLVRAVWKKAWLVALVGIVCAVAVLLGTILFITPEYQSSAMFYVNNSSVSVGNISFSPSDLNASRDLVDSYIVILKSRTSLNDVIDYAEVALTPSQLANMISAAPVNSTEIFEVVVTSTDRYEAERIANAIAYVLPKRIDSIIEGTSVKIVDYAIVAAKPSSPSYTTNTLIGLLLGLLLSAGVVAVKDILDVSVRTEEDIQQVCDHPVLTAVPELAAPAKRGTPVQEIKTPIGPEMSFAAAEAYKLLRTKLQFSFADDKQCHVIGVSSALSGEGKSVTAVNLAYVLSQLDKKVLLIDCDMRRPTVAEKMSLKKYPGLSGYLTGQHDMNGMIQKCGFVDDESAFHVITAGQNPPNPVELLSSEKMREFLVQLRKFYDYVILDLPPVGGVSDAMAVAKEIDGMLLVVRQHHCNRYALKDAVRQFAFIGTKILGVVYNGTSEQRGKYGGYYGGYGNYYGRPYSRTANKYEATAEKAHKAEKTRK